MQVFLQRIPQPMGYTYKDYAKLQDVYEEPISYRFFDSPRSLTSHLFAKAENEAVAAAQEHGYALPVRTNDLVGHFSPRLRASTPINKNAYLKTPTSFQSGRKDSFGSSSI
ncbi:hypothetical protein T310_0446 [Rasamsonia emersonii CBS 393.64]|uniref:Uncharacterized protein n=1 Tax=Rasamsonia emersonii (strain ATCC 16479 / CBS 393.64 / IMI 116815) TaxID=1408163 RepID=A0A0F4Z4Q0_RASE3|nr:hypothetical protein T310_0446 [Rasamsonia emersonii CBS 393.64]KKA25492.1 hypothetical protein T310_0446 [Rasamsonia emersonii CBS 393.64]